MTTIENDHFKVTIKPKGAELTSLYNKATGVEQLWQADANFWASHAPNLFPIVGMVIDNQLLADGRTFPLSRHGFARNNEFVLLEQSDVHAIFSLPYSAETLKVYPYKYDFQIIYNLIDNALRVTYKVINLDDRTIYFSVGGHPAFNVPFNAGEQYEDYYLLFEVQEELHRHLLSANGFLNGETELVPLQDKKLHLTRELFNRDALVFKNVQSKMITIASDKHEQTLSVEFPHFEHLGIWAKPGANFVCIEPWMGYTDTEGRPTDISQKEGIHTLKMGHTFEASFYISI